MAGQPLSTAFSIDQRVTLKLEPELAIALGTLILSTKTDNTALLALGHKLRSLTNGTRRTAPQEEVSSTGDGG